MQGKRKALNSYNHREQLARWISGHAVRPDKPAQRSRGMALALLEAARRINER